MKWLVVAACAAASCCPSPDTKPVAAAPPAAPPAPAPPPEPVADTPLPTLRLPRDFTPESYSAELAVDPAKPDFTGEISITGALDKASAVIWLNGKNLDIAEATATPLLAKGIRSKIVMQPKPVTVTPHGDYLELRPKEPMRTGRWLLHLKYRGHVATNGFRGVFVTKYGSDPYIATQFESLGARLAFPCIDEPDRYQRSPPPPPRPRPPRPPPPPPPPQSPPPPPPPPR
jgi:hypothetical protein